MKNQISISLARLSHEIYIEPRESVFLPWFRDIHVLDVDDDFVDLEPADFPVIALSRALSAHLKLCGVLDGFDYPNLPVVEVGYSHTCKLDFDVEYNGDDFRIAISIKYDYRDPEKREAEVALTEADILQHFMDRVIFGKPCPSLTAMKFGYIFSIMSIQCTINGLEVLL